MKSKQCEVIQDLLPLYIDNICSVGSRCMVSDHLETCRECRNLYENMRQSVKRSPDESDLDSEQAFIAINRKWRKKKIALICSTTVLTAIAFFIICMVYQNVSIVHDYFSPSTAVFLRDIPDDSKWYRLDFENSDVLVLNSIFYEKKVTLDGNSDSPVSIRILDNDGNIVMDKSIIEPGRSLDLNALHRNTEYVVEIKTAADSLLLRFH